MDGREVLAFDLYGTLVDPVAISSELGRVLGEADSAEAARLWRGKQLEYSFRLTAMGRYEDFGWVTARANRSAAPFDTIGQPPDLTVPGLDRLPAALAGLTPR